MKQQLFTGSGVAIITPMFADGTINYLALDELIEFQIQNGSDAIIVCGTTGEASTLADEDHLDVIAHCVKTVGGRVPVIAGTGANDTQHAIRLSQGAQKGGANGLLQVTPYYNKTSQSGLIKHFLAVANSVDLPIILYNVPSRTGMSITVDTYCELAKHPRIVATKEASGDIAHVAQVAAACGNQLGIYSGNDDQIVPILSLGGLGVISVLANVAPRQVHEMCTTYFSGNTKTSCRMQLDAMALVAALFCDVNPIPVKKAVEMMGIAAGPCRLPLDTLTDTNAERLQNEMRRYGLL